MVTDDLNLVQFAEKYKINVKTLRYRLNAGWSVEKIINTPVSQSINISKYLLPCNISLKQHCKQNNYCYTAVFNYIKKYNLEPHEALAKYIEKNRNIKK